MPELPWRSTLLASAALVTYAVPGLAEALWLQPGTHEPWRWLTAHWVHHSPEHLLWDTAGCAAVAVALEQLAPRRLLPTLVAAAVTVSAAMALTLPPDAVYGGLSGIASALFVAVALPLARRPGRDRWLAGAMLVAFAAKLGAEALTGGVLFAASDGVHHATLAHLVGGATGTLVGVPWLPARSPA